MTKDDVVKLVEANAYHKIRAGETHRFIDISIVMAENRLFVRQYSFSRRSWYHAFQEDPNGAIKCGEVIIKVHGVIPGDLNEISQKVSDAYLNKYGEPARIMTEARYAKSTLELIPIV